MPISTDPISDDEIKRWLTGKTDVPEGTFELALVLGGGGSCGAYTAGALDFLIEALDIWTALRAAGPDKAPQHSLKLKVIAGTSAGGINAAITARALAYQFPPVTRGNALIGHPTGNPFYDIWINAIDLAGLLDPADIRSGKVSSLLNGGPLDAGATAFVNFTGPAKPRTYVGAGAQGPLRLILTMTNLLGLPYRTDLGNGLGETFINHADFVRVAVIYPGDGNIEFRPDELSLNFDGKKWPQAVTWQEFSTFALATGAFPLGLPARTVVRPMEHYRWRVAVVPAVDGQPEVRPLVPAWKALETADGTVPDDFRFMAVDGGATDNEPIELARTALAGIGNRNPRTGTEANRGVLLIDPFAGVAAPPTAGPELFSVAFGVLSTFLQQTRYDTSDLLLAADPDVFSRYMLTPARAGLIGEKAIASAGLGAFLGFASKEFRRHDYLLGRQNCQALLRKVLVVDADNPIVRDHWNAGQIAAHGYKQDGRTYVSLIPLFGAATVDETPAPWPRGVLDPNEFRGAIEARWRALLEAESQNSPLGHLLGWFGSLVSEAAAADFLIGKMRQALQDWDL